MLLAALLLAAGQVSLSEPSPSPSPSPSPVSASPAETEQRTELVPRAGAEVEARRATMRTVGVQGLVAGVLLLGIGAGCIGGAAGSATALRDAATVMSAMQLRDQGKGWQVASGVMLTLGVAVVVTSAVLLVLGRDPGGRELAMLAGMWP